MADERNVITILVQAIDRATGALSGTRKSLRDLEAQEKKNVTSSERLDRANDQLSESYKTYAERVKEAGDSEYKLRLLQQQRRDVLGRLGPVHRDYLENLRLIRQEHESLTDATEDTNDEQLTFFDRLSTGNKLLGERRKLLRDTTGEEIRATDAFQRRDRIMGLSQAGRIVTPAAGRSTRLGTAGAGGGGQQLSFLDDPDVVFRGRMENLARFSSRINNVRTSLAGVIPFFRRFKLAQQGAFDPADLTRFDETMELGFRRVARLLATLSVFLPFLTVGFGAVLGGLTAVVGGVTSLAAAFGTLAGVVATLPGLLAATIGAAGALVAIVGPGLSDVAERFKEITQIQDQARKRTTENATAQRDAEEALADSRQQIAQQLADIDRQIGETRRRGAEQVGDQERDLSRLRVTNAEQEMDLVRDIRRAKREAADDAREAELRYQEIVSQNRIDEREIAAELSVRRSQLGALRLQGADAATVGQAQAAVFASEREQARIVAANRREERTARKAADDERRNNVQQIADLERRLGRTRRENAQQESDAERRIARTRHDNARDVLDLERRRQQVIVQGARAERDALQRLTTARAASAGDFKDSLEGLTVTQKGMVLQLLRIRQAWLDITEATRERGLQFITRALGQLEQRLPEIANALSGITDTLLDVGDDALARFTSPERWARFSRILADTRVNAGRIAESLVDVLDALLTITDVARPLTSRITEGVRSAAADFNKAVQEQEQSGGLDRFFAATNRVLTLTIGSLKNLGNALLDVLVIAEPFGEILLGDFLEWTRGIEEWTSSSTGARALTSFFEDSLPVVEALANFVDELAQAFFRVGRDIIRPDATSGVSLLQEIIESLTNTLPDLENFLRESFAVNGPVVIEFLKQFTHFMGVLVGPGGAIVQFLGLMSAVLRFINKMPDDLERLIFTYLVFHKTIVSLSGVLARLGIALKGLAFGGAGVGISRNVFFGLSIAALLTFPGIIDAIADALNGLGAAVRTVLAPVDRLLSLMGLGEQRASTFVNAVGVMALALLVFKRGALAGAILDLILFFRLLRTSQAANIFLKLLDAVVTMFGIWIQRVRLARSETQKLVATNIVSSFSNLANSISAAVAALLQYIAQARAARRANIALAASNAAVGASNLFAGVTGLSGLLSGLGRAGSLARALAPALIRISAVLGAGFVIGKGFDKVFGTDLFERKSRDEFNDEVNAVLVDPFVNAAKRLGSFFSGLGPDPFGIRGAIERSIGDDNAAAVQEKISSLERIGHNVAVALDSLSVSFAQAMRNSLTQMDIVLTEVRQRMQKLDTDLQGMLSAVSGIQSTLGGFIRGRAESVPVPAQLALDALDRGETLRSRSQRRQQANQDLAESRRQQRQAEASLETSMRRLARLRTRLARSRTGAFGVGTNDPTLTPQQRRALQGQIRDQQATVRERQQELNEAKKRVREVATARAEVLRQVALEERREVLARQVALQTAQREKEIRAAEQRANDAMEAYVKAIDGEENLGKLRQARNKLIAALREAGVPTNLTKAWLAGHRLGEDFGSGLSNAVREFQKKFRVLLGDLVAKNKIPMPVLIVTDAPTIRRMILTPRKPQPGDPGVYPAAKERGAAGLVVHGREGAAVPITAHAGEWVLNRSQQTRAALMAGLDRSVLQRALFHLQTPPKFAYAMGGVVTSGGGTSYGGTTFLTPINIETASATVDAEYVARAFESRIRQVI